jgi:alpha(1,3/1,4) fucosyltransferase
MNTTTVRLYIDPPSHHFLQDQLFSSEKSRYGGDDLMAPYIYLRGYLEQQGIEIHTADYLPEQPDHKLNLYISLGMFRDYEKLSRRADVMLSAFFIFESPIVEPGIYRKITQLQHNFRRIFTWSDSASLLHFTRLPLHCRHFHWPQSFDQVHEQIWSGRERKFLVMINANKLPRLYWNELYTERMRAVAYFSQHGEIDLYGIGWNEPSWRLGRTHVPYTITRSYRFFLTHWQKIKPDPLLQAARKVYRGKAESKSTTLGGYTFSLCFENMILKGWITEKIFDCFFAGTVPIYLGAPDIQDHIPQDCFIDMRHFPDYASLHKYLKSLTPDQVDGFRLRARQFLASSQYEPFTRRAFAEQFRQIILGDAGLSLEAPV